MSDRPDEKSCYDRAAIEVLLGLDPPRKQGVTISGELPDAQQKRKACVELLRTDSTLWYIRLVGKNGEEMLIYRGPHP